MNFKKIADILLEANYDLQIKLKNEEENNV